MIRQEGKYYAVKSGSVLDSSKKEPKPEPEDFTIKTTPWKEELFTADFSIDVVGNYKHKSIKNESER